MKERAKRNLEIRTVGLEELEQFNELLKYAFQVTKHELLESGYEEGEIEHAKQPILQSADVIGWFDNDKLVSQLSVYPCKVNIHGTIYTMGGLTGVSTYPEYSGLGLMSELIYKSLCRMKSRKQCISYLYPYSIPYYRKKGWEIISDHMTYTIKDTQLPQIADISGVVRRVPVDDQDVIKAYDLFASLNHGALIRDKQNWEEYWRWENEEERMAAVYYDVDENPTGYILYWIENDIFHIKDMIFINQMARSGLWNFIIAHFSMINLVKGNSYKSEPIAFLLDDGHILETIEPYFMARIVDVESFLQKYPFKTMKSPIHFIVSDPIAEWNNGVWSIEFGKNRQTIVGHKNSGPCVNLSIQTLGTLLMSYQRPSYLSEIGRLDTNSDGILLLENMIPDKKAYFSDYF